MLTHLTISQFAIIEALELDIAPDLTVITGETGAGKSIMLDALGLALGNRADADMIRQSEDHTKAEIHACFNISHHDEAKEWLANRDLEAADECILRRVITREGRSKGYINGSPQPITALRELGSLLVSIHGQHEHQALMKKDTHRALLDQFGQLNGQCQMVSHSFNKWKTARETYLTHRNNAQELADRVDLLKFQLQEFHELSLQKGEYQQLEQDHRKMANAETLAQSAQQLLDGLTDQDQALNAQLQHLTSLAQDMTRQDSDVQDIAELLNSACIQLEEAASSLRHYRDKLDMDPELYQKLDQKLGTAYQLARKHRIDPYEIPQHQQHLQAELDTIDGGEEKLQQLEAKAEKAHAEYLKKAKALSKSRQQQAKKLSQTLTDQIKDLGMPEAKMEVLLTPYDEAAGTAHGLEQIEFHIQTNPGQAIKPLAKIASGGELARISLAIQVACAAKTNVATLMFDEVDVGVGGKTAHIVGRLLRGLGNDNQVICVTHQPQVAAQGHHHLYVSKELVDGNTHTQIDVLDAEQRIEEIARMLGGREVNAKTMAHAQSLIEDNAD